MSRSTSAGHPGLVRRFRGTAVPTLVVVDHGEETARTAGAAPAAEPHPWAERAVAGRRREAPGSAGDPPAANRKRTP
ncbi:hypothetical protein ACFYT4_14910 [Streptomyces sp. NPDC004609]|uniref:hypothetical protein n=1 Tax=Streptomyces sp. NPDC004609 TaxID=3364704 RepID=UPI0036A19293